MTGVVKKQGKVLLLAIPFIVLLLIDIIVQHICLILAIISVLLVYERFNDQVIHQYIKREKCSKWKLLAIVFYSTSICFIIIKSPLVAFYWMIDEHFFLEEANHGFWNQLVSVFMMDYVFKYLVLILKCLLVLSNKHQSHRKKLFKIGSIFFVIEVISQLVRCAVPVVQWITYCIYNSHENFLLRVICTCFYSGIKMFFIVNKVQLFWNVFGLSTPCKAFVMSSSINTTQETCPLCDDVITNFAVVQCKKRHHLCSECASTWFDRFPKCPCCQENWELSQVYLQYDRSTREPEKPANLLQLSNFWKSGTTDSLVYLF